MQAIAHGGGTDNVRKSALEADSGRNIPCLTGYSKPRHINIAPALSVWRSTSWAIAAPVFFHNIVVAI